MKPIISLLLISLLLTGCSWFKVKEKVWTDLPETYFAEPLYAKYLEGFKIVLDPGHGGLAHLKNYKRGPTGVREAEINLRVAVFLKEFLEQAGAEVILTRDGDYFVSLDDRAKMANESGADFMISLHHNASSRPSANHASVYYHIHPDLSPASMDLARNVYLGIVDALHLHELSKDGLHSDQLIYPSGFGLLRGTKIPVILCESSFHSNPQEEKRLKNEEYNRREAYGIFCGVARYVQGGIPSASLINEDTFSVSKTPLLRLNVTDGLRSREGWDAPRLRLFSNMIDACVDGQKVPFKYDREASQITIQIDSSLANGEHYVEMNLINLFKNSNLPCKCRFIIASPCRKIRFLTPADSILADGISYLSVDIEFLDMDDQSIWDGSEYQVYNSGGILEHNKITLAEGKVRLYLHSDYINTEALLFAQADEAKDSLRIQFVKSGLSIFQGEISDVQTQSALADVNIFWEDSLFCQTDFDGRFFKKDLPADKYDLRIAKKGYHTETRAALIKENKTTILNAQLEPVDQGVFLGQSIILDAQFGGSEVGAQLNDTLTASVYNLQVMLHLAELLDNAGMQVYQVRQNNLFYPVDERIKWINEIPDGFYLRFGASWTKDDSARTHITIYPGSMNAQNISQNILDTFKQIDFSSKLDQNVNIPEVRNTNKTAVALELQIKSLLPAEEVVNKIYDALKKYYHSLRLQ